MGFDGIASQAIMFIAVLSASALLVVAFQSHMSDTSASIATKQKALSLQIRSEIAVESVYYNTSGSKIVIYAKNTGKTQIDPTDITVYVDNIYVLNNSRTIEILADTNTVNSDIWDPKEVLQVTVTSALDSGTTHSVTLRTAYAATNTVEFTI